MITIEDLKKVTDTELVELFNQSVGVKATNQARQNYLNSLQKEFETRHIDVNQIESTESISYKFCVVLENNTLKRVSSLSRESVSELLVDYFKKYHKLKALFEPILLSYDNNEIQFVLHGHEGNLKLSSNGLIKSLISNLNLDPFATVVKNNLKMDKNKNEAILAERLRKIAKISERGIEKSLRPTKESLGLEILIPYYVSSEILDLILSKYHATDKVKTAFKLGYQILCETKWYDGISNQSKELLTEETFFTFIEGSIKIGYNHKEIEKEVLKLKEEGLTNEQILEKFDDFDEIDKFRISDIANPYEHALRSLEHKLLTPEQAMNMFGNINSKKHKMVELQKNAQSTFYLNLKKQSEYKDLVKLRRKYTLFVIIIISIYAYILSNHNGIIGDYFIFFIVIFFISVVYCIINYSKKSEQISRFSENLRNNHFKENYLTIDKATSKLVETLKRKYEVLTDNELDETYLKLTSIQTVKSNTQCINYFVLHKEFEKRYGYKISPFYVSEKDDNKIKINLLGDFV